MGLPEVERKQEIRGRAKGFSEKWEERWIHRKIVVKGDDRRGRRRERSAMEFVKYKKSVPKRTPSL